MGRPDIDAFLGSVREADQPRPVDRARIHRAFREKLARQGLSAPAPPIPDRVAEPSLAAPTSPAAPLCSRFALLLGTAAVSFALIHALSSARSTPSRAAASPATAAPAMALAAGTQPTVHAVASPQLAQAPASFADRALPISSAPPRASRGSGRSQPASAPDRAPSGASAPDGLALEIALLASARSSLQADRPRAALAQLAQHERRFATGALRDEREGLRVLALCQLQRYRAAAEARERYLERAPTSLLAAQVRAACAPDETRLVR